VTPALLPQTQIAALPGVLYETLAHPSGIENIFARRMVLASGFRGSSLRLPLSGMVYCEIATRTLKEVRVLLISKRGRREEKSRGWKRQSLVSRPQNHEPSHAVKILRQLLTFVKGIGPLKCPIERSSTLEFPSSHENSAIRESPCAGFTRSVCAYPPIPI